MKARNAIVILVLLIGLLVFMWTHQSHIVDKFVQQPMIEP